MSSPPTADPHTVRTRYWRRLDDSRVRCELCPRACSLREGQRGLCFVRECRDGEIVLTSHGRSSGFCVDNTCCREACTSELIAFLVTIVCAISGETERLRSAPATPAAPEKAGS